LLIYSFIRDLPREVLDSGRIDGCNSWNLLRHIVAPLSRPAMLTLLVFNFMWTWNQFLLPIVLIQIDSKRTLPVGLNFFQGQFANDIPLLMAGATITFMPIVIIYLIFQRHFIQGIAAGALKS
jgi:raffinose/stachyose/melibiose transport system permease protein